MLTAKPELILDWFRQETGDTCDMLLDRLSDAEAIWICGGSILSCLINKKLNDLDVCVEGRLTREYLDQCFKIVGKNFFDGSIYKHNGLKMDIWPLNDSARLSKFQLPPTVESLLKLFPHNLDKAAIDLKTGKFVDIGMVNGINNRLIDWDTPDKVPHIHAARSIMLREKTGFDFSDSTKGLIKEAKVLLREVPALWEEVRRALASKSQDLFSIVVRELTYADLP